MASAPEELKLDWVIDGTNTIYGYKFSSDSARTVSEQIQHLKSVVYDMSGEIHQPRFLKIMGLGIHQRGNGDVTFDGILTDLQITYTLFAPDGEPLRAKISATFLDYRENKRRVLEEAKESPDLTHVRTVKDGEKLPLIVYQAYKDPTYHMEIAKVNNLTNFRKIAVGQELVLPPIEKTIK
ncbi:MAG: LysM peptidoglycan-binding domain-containing protein [Bacteroidales bacterium]|nr:LysM peptidoglycan-binding domain-containing protein [Bacteroidales bacterium]